MRTSWPLVTAKSMAAIDGRTVSQHDIPAELLMEAAGVAVAQRAEALAGAQGSVLILAGGGNNGGDGWVAARHLQLRGVAVAVLDSSGEGGRAPLAEVNRRRALSVGVRESDGASLPDPGVVVDCLLGTGSSRNLAGPFAEWAKRLSERPPTSRVLAVDLPTGIHADTGAVLGCAVRADETLCLGLPKLGLTLFPGRSFAGEIRVAGIGIDTSFGDSSPDAELLTHRGAGELLPERPPAGHKGTFGHVLVVGGGVGKAGAAALSARGAIGGGAGLVTVACPEASAPVVTAACCEAMTLPLATGGAGGIAAVELPRLLEEARARDVVVIGPGLGRDPESEGWVLEFLTSLEGPLLIDADALHVAAKDAAAVANRDGATLLTPHPGEAGAMLGWDTPAVTAQRLDAARELAAVFGATVALKGAPTVTQGPEDPPWINATGGSHLGTGGTGDVLAGVIAAFVAQGLSALDAVRLGIHVHGLAGDRLAASRGPAGLRAGQVADVLPETLAFLTERARQPASQTGEAGVVAFPEP